MSIQVTIIGLGQIGASIGLALGDKKDQFFRIGNDARNDIARRAEKLGATDKTVVNIPNSVENADIVVLAVPSHEVQEIIEIISPDLKTEAVVLGTSPISVAVIDWVKENLPKERYFVTFTPSLNPSYFSEEENGLDAAHADLFNNSVIAISSLPSTHPDAVKLASDFATILGATSYFADPYESDGLIAATHQLPKVIAAALVKSTTDQPGWQEGRKLAGIHFAETTRAIYRENDSKSIGQELLLNKENVVRVIDNLMGALREMRELIQIEDSEKLQAIIEDAITQRAIWWSKRLSSNWTADKDRPQIPSASEAIGGMFGFRRKVKKDQKGEE